jgi:putative toxin-antitoxin system antitoxin component (TIGR02293 family)
MALSKDGKYTKTRVRRPLRAEEPRLPGEPPPITYRASKGVDDFVVQLRSATPWQLIELERHGVPGSFIKDLAKRLGMPAAQVFRMLGLPKATAEKKAAAGEAVAGSAGLAALGVVRLLALAQDIVDDSTAEAARGFDTGRWLGRWLEEPHRALGGRTAAELVDTPTGLEAVMRLLGALQSGAYQ